jgi:hypothetical protein
MTLQTRAKEKRGYETAAIVLAFRALALGFGRRLCTLSGNAYGPARAYLCANPGAAHLHARAAASYADFHPCADPCGEGHVHASRAHTSRAHTSHAHTSHAYTSRARKAAGAYDRHPCWRVYHGQRS